MKKIFELAYIQLEREGLLNKENENINILERAIKIRHWLDIQARNLKIAQRRKLK